MKTRVPSKPDWPPVIGSGITPFIRLRDTILTIIAWIFVVALLWEVLELLWDDSATRSSRFPKRTI